MNGPSHSTRNNPRCTPIAVQTVGVQTLSIGTVDHARRTATLCGAMLEKVAASVRDGRRGERHPGRRHRTHSPRGSAAASLTILSVLAHSFARALGRALLRRIAGFLRDFYSTLTTSKRAVLLDTPIRVEMKVSSFAATKLCTLLDTYFDPCLLDTQMHKLRSVRAVIFFRGAVALLGIVAELVCGLPICNSRVHGVILQAHAHN